MLNQRQRTILFELVHLFLESGEPVSSAQISRCESVSVSSATVRNVLSELELLDVVRQPHTSAGRIPTPQGLRLYVDSLSAEGVVKKAASDEALQDAFERLNRRDLDSAVRGMGGILSGLARMTSVLTLPVLEQLTLTDLHLSKLADKRVMAVLVTSDEQVHHRVVQLDVELDLESVRRMEHYLSQLALGKTLRDVHACVAQEKAQLAREWNTWVACALSIGEKALELQPSAALHIEGVFNIFEYAELTADMERMKHLLGLLEEREQVLTLLEQLLEKSDGPRVLIGPELNWDLGDDFSLVVCSYTGSDGQGQGMMGVLGPARMDYATVMPLVYQAAHLFSAFLTNH